MSILLMPAQLVNFHIIAHFFNPIYPIFEGDKVVQGLYDQQDCTPM